MAYDEKIVIRALLRDRYLCRCCGRDIFSLPGETPKFHVHSALSLHAIEDPSDRSRFIPTSVPYALRNIKGRSLPKRGFLVWQLGQPDDAFSLCIKCHRELHNLATEIAGPNEYKNIPPKLLEEVTLYFLGYI